jgi:hypothetical protein
MLGIQQFYAESASVLPPGEHQVRMEFAYAGGGLGKGGTAALFVDGKKVGEGKVAATAAMIFSADDGCDVGVDTGSPVSPDYGSRQRRATRHCRRRRKRRSPRLAGGSGPHRHGTAVNKVVDAFL